MYHKNAPPAQRHAPHSFEYATATAREAAVGLTADDIHKLALQLDNDSYWILSGVAPLTWTSMGTAHGHAIADVTGLQAALDGKSATGHNHDVAYDAAGAAAAAVAAHAAAADPHTGYAMAAPSAAAVAYNAGGTTTITLDGGRTEVFAATAATGATTWSFTGAAASGKKSEFDLELTNGGSQTQTWPASVKWDGGTAPTLTAAGVDILTFYTRDGGTTWRGFLAAKDSK